MSLADTPVPEFCVLGDDNAWYLGIGYRITGVKRDRAHRSILSLALADEPEYFVSQRLAEFAMLIRVEMDAIFLAGDDHRSGVEVEDVLPARRQSIVV